jgi:hypothetical protein
MILSTRSPRSRVVALAAGLALSLSLVAAPAVVAEDDGPQAVVQSLLADIEAKNFEAIVGYFCEEFADQASSLDLSEMAASLPPGVDTDSVFDAFDFTVVLDSLETVSETDNEAIVKVVASLSMNIDVAALEPLIVAVLEAGGQEATPDMVEMVGGMMAGQLAAESIDISEDITVVRNEDGTWGKICSELGIGDGADEESTTDAAASGSDEAVEG